jgi:hypothetical protein
MSDQTPDGPRPDDKSKGQSHRPSIDDLIAGLPEESRKALHDEREARMSQIERYRRTISDLQPKAQRLDELEDSVKTEVQRATDLATRAAKERDDAKASLLRYEVAAGFPGLQASDAAFLTGTTREELENSAERLLARIQAAGEQRPGPQVMQPDKGQGRNGQQAEIDPDAWLRGALKQRH